MKIYCLQLAINHATNKSDSGNAQYDPAKSGISTVADTAGELVKEMVYMNWQFLSADYYTKACLGTRYTLTTVVFRVQ